MLKNYGGWLAVFFAGIIPVIALVTVALGFGDYFHEDPEVENAYRAGQVLYSKIGVFLIVLSYLLSIGFSVATMKKQTKLAIASLCICAGYAAYVVIAVF